MYYIFSFFMIATTSLNALHYGDTYSNEDVEAKLKQPAQQLKYAAVCHRGVLWEPDEILTSAHAVLNQVDPGKDVVTFYNPQTKKEQTVRFVSVFKHPLYIENGGEVSGVDIARVKLSEPVTVVEPLPINRTVVGKHLTGRVTELISYGNFYVNNKSYGKLTNAGKPAPHFGQAIIEGQEAFTNNLEIEYKKPGTARCLYSAVPVDGDSGSVMLKEIAEADGTKLRIVGIMSNRAIIKNWEDYGQRASYIPLYETLNLHGFEDFFTKPL